MYNYVAAPMRLQKAFLYSLAAHAIFLLLILFVTHKETNRTLEIALIVQSPTEQEHEELDLKEIPQENKRQQRQKNEVAKRVRSKTKRQKSVASGAPALKDPWSSYESQMFARNSKTTAESSHKSGGTSWGSEKFKRDSKGETDEVVVIPQGRKQSTTAWRKGGQRKLVSLPSIDYPESVRKKSGQGVVKLLIEVDSKGRVTSVEVEESSGIIRLDLNARNAYRRAVFSPSASGESAVGVVTVRFLLKD